MGIAAPPNHPKRCIPAMHKPGAYQTFGETVAAPQQISSRIGTRVKVRPANASESAMTAAAATKPDRRRLAHLLRAAHAPLDPDGVAELVAGVLAAPVEIGDSWHQLVADPTPPALAEALEELRAHMAAGYHDGLSREDFARLPRAARVARLREVMAAREIDGFIVPRADEYQGEYVPPAGQRLAWLTGFTGSAGLAIVLRDRAALFVDGRYTLQAAAQVETALFEIRHLVDEPAWRWLAGVARQVAVIGYAPTLP